MFTFKPTNHNFVVDVKLASNDARANMIYQAYEAGKKLRLDSTGIVIAFYSGVVDSKFVAIDRKYL